MPAPEKRCTRTPLRAFAPPGDQRIGRTLKWLSGEHTLSTRMKPTDYVTPNRPANPTEGVT